jgi:hypothetical protein
VDRPLGPQFGVRRVRVLAERPAEQEFMRQHRAHPPFLRAR